MKYYILNSEGFYLGLQLDSPNGYEFYTTIPPIGNFFKFKFDGENWVEGATPEELLEAQKNKIPLFEEYPDIIDNYRTIQLDNLQGIIRKSTLADKGLKGEKKYYKGDKLVWSTEKIYWFQEGGFELGFKRVVKVFDGIGEVFDTWEVAYELSEDDKQFFLEEQRRMIFHYFKSQQPDLFNLLYTFFKSEIDTYVALGGDDLKNTLIAASQDYPVQIVTTTLNTEIPTQSGTTVTVLQGILFELV